MSKILSTGLIRFTRTTEEHLTLPEYAGSAILFGGTSPLLLENVDDGIGFMLYALKLLQKHGICHWIHPKPSSLQ